MTQVRLAMSLHWSNIRLLLSQAEVDDTLKRIQEHKGVQGFLIINNDGNGSDFFFSLSETSQTLFDRVRRVSSSMHIDRECSPPLLSVLRLDDFKRIEIE